jgi:hypothetical protein
MVVVPSRPSAQLVSQRPLLFESLHLNTRYLAMFSSSGFADRPERLLPLLASSLTISVSVAFGGSGDTDHAFGSGFTCARNP